MYEETLVKDYINSIKERKSELIQLYESLAYRRVRRSRKDEKLQEVITEIGNIETITKSYDEEYVSIQLQTTFQDDMYEGLQRFWYRGDFEKYTIGDITPQLGMYVDASPNPSDVQGYPRLFTKEDRHAAEIIDLEKVEFFTAMTLKQMRFPYGIPEQAYIAIKSSDLGIERGKKIDWINKEYNQYCLEVGKAIFELLKR